MDEHCKLRNLAIAQGLKIEAVAARRLPSRGLGIVAERKIEAGEEIIDVPISSLGTIDNVAGGIVKRVTPCTVHGLLAADLALNKDSNIQAWLPALPTCQDFESRMPLTWAPELQALLPPAAARIVETQRSKLAKDWTSVSEAYPALIYKTYLHAWLIVNTRTFYFESPTACEFKTANREDCMATVPFVDFFNHSSRPTARVEVSPLNYLVVASRTINKDDEILISYGMHNNDYLLAEYGFIIDDNRLDETSLDDQILRGLSEKQKAALEFEGFLGHYVLDRHLTCHRTQVALRLLCTSRDQWKGFVNGTDDGEDTQHEADKLLVRVIQDQIKEAQETIDRIQTLKAGCNTQRETLGKRWKQIALLLNDSLDKV